MKKLLFFLIILILASLIVLKFIFLYGSKYRIAHAGGGYSSKIYTNSIEALNYNKNKYEFFEIDFFLTKDNKLVCLHDKHESLKSFNDFEIYLNTNSLYKHCTYKTLKKWLNENPTKKIVTDVKDDNIKALIFISKNFENFENRFIPQIYYSKNYNKVRKIGFKDIIWTLYRCCSEEEGNDKVISEAKKMKLFAITMPSHRSAGGLAKELKKINIRTYTHTINSRKKMMKQIFLLGVSEVYTDWLD